MKKNKIVLISYMILLLSIIITLIYNIYLGDIIGYTDGHLDVPVISDYVIKLVNNGKNIYIFNIGALVTYISIILIFLEYILFNKKIKKYIQLNFFINIIWFIYFIFTLISTSGGRAIPLLYNVETLKNYFYSFKLYEFGLDYPYDTFISFGPFILLLLCIKIFILLKNNE